MGLRTLKTRPELVEDYIGGTSLHGIADAHGAENHCMRIVWTVAIVAAAAGAFYEIGMVVKDYIGSPLLTVYERKAEIRLQFPIIQICPSHFVNKSLVYVDRGMHPSVVDEYLGYFASAAEATFTNYTGDRVERSSFDREFKKLPLAYLVVSSSTRSQALERLNAVLAAHPTFFDFAEGDKLLLMYKTGFYDAAARKTEATCWKAKLTTDPDLDCSEHNYDEMRRRKRSVDEPTLALGYEGVDGTLRVGSEAQRVRRDAGFKGIDVFNAVMALDMKTATYNEIVAAADSAAAGGTSAASETAAKFNDIIDLVRPYDMIFGRDQILGGLLEAVKTFANPRDNGEEVSAFNVFSWVNNTLVTGLANSMPSAVQNWAPPLTIEEFLIITAKSAAAQVGGADMTAMVDAAKAAHTGPDTDQAIVDALAAKWEELKPTTSTSTTSTTTPTTVTTVTTPKCENCTTTTTSTTTSTTSTTTITTTTTLPSTGYEQFDQYLYEAMPSDGDHLSLVGGLASYPSETADFIDSIAMDVGEILVGCNWRSKYMECSHMARSTFDAKLGRCFTLDLDFGRVQISEGMGLIAVVDLRREVQWTFRPEIAAGVNIRIMDTYDPITVGDLWAPVGTVTKIDLRSTKYQFHTDPKYEACHQDIDRQILNSNYSDSLCRAECLMQAQLSRCSCIQITPKEFLIEPDLTQCRDYAQRRCLEDYMQKEEWVDEVSDCFSNCRPACEYWEHVPIVTYSAFPSKVYKDYVEFSAPDLAARLDNYLLLDISYARLQYSQIRQEISITVDGFLSQIGGHLGLFLGSSVLSLCQLVIFLVNVLCCARGKKIGQSPGGDGSGPPPPPPRITGPQHVYYG